MSTLRLPPGCERVAKWDESHDGNQEMTAICLPVSAPSENDSAVEALNSAEDPLAGWRQTYPKLSDLLRALEECPELFHLWAKTPQKARDWRALLDQWRAEACRELAWP